MFQSSQACWGHDGGIDWQVHKFLVIVTGSLMPNLFVHA